jgi:hypothetical protein
MGSGGLTQLATAGGCGTAGGDSQKQRMRRAAADVAVDIGLASPNGFSRLIDGFFYFITEVGRTNSLEKSHIYRDFHIEAVVVARLGK